MIADDGVLDSVFRADVPHRDVAGADADTDRQLLVVLEHPLAAESLQDFLRPEGSGHRPLGVVFKRNGVAEEGQDPVAQVLVQGASMTEDDFRQGCEVLVEGIDQFLRLHRVRPFP